MKILLSLVGLLAIVGLVSPCCVPDGLQFDWELDVKSRSLGSDGLPRVSLTLSGRAAYIISEQLFYTSFDNTAARGQIKMFMDLSRQNGFMVRSMKDGYQTSCRREKVYGQIRRPWRCFLDKMKPMSGKPHYKIDIPDVMAGVVYMRRNTCIPTGARIVIDTDTGNGPDKLTLRLNLSHVGERIDMTVFDSPCITSNTGPPFTIPTPEDVYRKIRNGRVGK